MDPLLVGSHSVGMAFTIYDDAQRYRDMGRNV